MLVIAVQDVIVAATIAASLVLQLTNLKLFPRNRPVARRTSLLASCRKVAWMLLWEVRCEYRLLRFRMRQGALSQSAK